jgi:hypothetical protein
MAEYILIGVGGTGAKIVEAALPLFLAGLGPDKVSVGFVDQDQANGNVARTRQRLQLYESFKTTWSGDRRPTRMDWAVEDSKGGVAFGRNIVRSLAPGHELWCPHPDRGATLQSIFGRALMPEDQKNLMDLLYEADETEQLMRLGEGYRARPHIGAAAMMSQAAGNGEFWGPLREKIEVAAGGEEVRIFFVGSVFGGTGAAGFPTIARVIRRIVQESAGRAPLRGKVHLGGALMLPYFSFKSPENRDDNVARSEQLLTQSRAALKYYHELFQREAVFDEFYLVGWSPRFQLGYNSAGGNAQVNPPLPPELLAALAAARFLDPTARKLPDAPTNTTFISARETATTLRWSDLPQIADGRAAEAYERLAQLLRFCTVWRNTIRPALKPKRFFNDAWFRNQEVTKVDFKDQANIESLKALDDLIESVLDWAVAMGGFATHGGLTRFALWDASPLAIFDGDNPTSPVQLRLLDGQAASAAYDNLIIPPDETSRPAGQDVLFDEINNHRCEGMHSGLGRVAAATFRAARVRALAFPSA